MLPSLFKPRSFRVAPSTFPSRTAIRSTLSNHPSLFIIPHRKAAVIAQQEYTVKKARNGTVYKLTCASLPTLEKGEEKTLDDYKGKVVLVVNTASKCGFTPQYAGLEKLYKDIKEKHGDDFVILGFPCNQFGGQEPGTNDDIQSFCQVNYGVSFPIMGKIDVNGDGASDLYKWLKKEKPGIMGIQMIKWNFEKFLIGRDGKVKNRWASTTKPESLEAPILEEIAKKE